VIVTVRALASMLFSTSSAIALRGLLCDRAIMVIRVPVIANLEPAARVDWLPPILRLDQFGQGSPPLLSGPSVGSRLHRNLPGPLRGRKDEVSSAFCRRLQPSWTWTLGSIAAVLCADPDAFQSRAPRDQRSVRNLAMPFGAPDHASHQTRFTSTRGPW